MTCPRLPSSRERGKGQETSPAFCSLSIPAAVEDLDDDFDDNEANLESLRVFVC